MDSHIQGPIASGATLGALVSQRGFLLEYTDTTKTLCIIDASANKPVLLKVTPIVETVFNAATTNVVKVGTDSDDDAYLAAGDVNEAATGVQASKSYLLRAKTTVTATYSQSGTAATTGKALILIEATGVGVGVGIAT